MLGDVTSEYTQCVYNYVNLLAIASNQILTSKLMAIGYGYNGVGLW